MAHSPFVVFLDNTVSGILRTVEVLSQYYPTKVFTDESELFALGSDEWPDLIFFNLDISPRDAVTVISELRESRKELKCLYIVYSDKQDDYIQELVFNCGADGFINFYQKPSILKPYVKNLLRRKNLELVNQRHMVVDTERYTVLKQGVPVHLPKKEFLLFSLLYNNPDKFFSKKEIALHIWNDELIANKRAIDVHVYNIRHELGTRVIQSRKGKGYRINKKFIE